jgi:hypothetical protein
MEGWSEFVGEMRRFYGVDLGVLGDVYRSEQAQYYSSTAAWTDVHPSALLGPAACCAEYDLLTVTLEELKAPLKARFTLPITEDGPAEALVGFFDVSFKGSPENPTDSPVVLSTAPDPTGKRPSRTQRGRRHRSSRRAGEKSSPEGQGGASAGPEGRAEAARPPPHPLGARPSVYEPAASARAKPSRSPSPTRTAGATHWGQQSFFLAPPVECAAGDSLECEVEITRRQDNHRLMQVVVKHQVVGESVAARQSVQRTSRFVVE